VIRRSEELKSEKAESRSNAGDVVEEKTEIKEVIEIPVFRPPPAPEPPKEEIIEEHYKKVTGDHRDISPGSHAGPVIVAARHRDEKAIRDEIRELEKEREEFLLLKERKHHRHRRGKSVEVVRRPGSGDLVFYEERVIPEPSSGARIERDRKGRMAISIPKKYR